MFWQKSSEACAATPIGGRRPERVEGLDPSGLRGDPDGAIDVPLPWQAWLAGGTDWSDQGDRRDARAVRLPPDPRAGEAGFDALRRTPQAGWHVNAKRIYRLYRDLGLQLRNKVPKRRVKAKLRDDRRPPERANETWARTSCTTSWRRGGRSAC
jgi:hypothetical protein